MRSAVVCLVNQQRTRRGLPALRVAGPLDGSAQGMASTDHCRNILNPSFRDIGTGQSDSSVGPYADGTWTQDFGLRLGQPAPSHNRGPMEGCPY
jgi:uncharacterized protein YkwD